jgi:hypothetical protein
MKIVTASNTTLGEVARLVLGEKDPVRRECHGEDVIDELVQFLLKNPNPSDKQIHKWAEERGWEPDDVEELIYRMVSTYAMFLGGGRANREGLKKSDVDPEELARGVEVEREHSDDIPTRERISLDHIAEVPKNSPLTYYEGLSMIEDFIKKLAKMNPDEAKKKLSEVKKAMGVE